MNRITIATRIFGLAAVFGMSITDHQMGTDASAVAMFCLLAVAASICEHWTQLGRFIPVVEGALVGLILETSRLQGQQISGYLIVPVLVAGLSGGKRSLLWTLLAEVLGLSIIRALNLEGLQVDRSLGAATPWLVTALGIGVLGSLINRLRVDYETDDYQRYVTAQRLLHELLDVSRRLSCGLDPVALSSRLLRESLTWVGHGGAQLLVQTEGGVFETLARHGEPQAGEAALDPVVARCWTKGIVACSEPHQAGTDRSAATRSPNPEMEAEPVRWALPLRVGPRMIGVLMLDTRQLLQPSQVEHLQQMLDERALPLETALLFDEIRRLATAEERHRLAREIHDGVAQEIASLGYLVDDLAVTSAEERPMRIEELRNGLTRVIDDLRLSIFELRSQVSGSTGLGLVMSEYLREVGLRSTMAVYLSIDEAPDRLAPGVEEELLRIVQEAVTNARRHSEAANLWVTCTISPPGVDLTVDDDGRGYSGARRGGFGVSIMRERAERIGATFDICRRPEGGTRISVRVPMLDEMSISRTDQVDSLWREQSLEPPLQEVTHG